MKDLVVDVYLLDGSNVGTPATILVSVLDCEPILNVERLVVLDRDDLIV